LGSTRRVIVGKAGKTQAFGDTSLEQQSFTDLPSQAQAEQITSQVVVAVVIDRPPHAM